MKALYRSVLTIIGMMLLMIPVAPSESAPPDAPVRKNEHIVLVHGFGRTGYDMRYLARYFTEQGYDISTPTLPAFIGTLESCTVALEQHVDTIDASYERVHLVGHSLGGLVIRNMLSRKEIPRLGRCFLIGTPNSGSPLAEIVKEWIWPLYHAAPIFSVLQPGGIDIPPPLNTPTPEIGVVAGNNNALLFGSLMNTPGDGRVPLNSVPFDGMAGIAVVPYHHEEMHHREETARIIQQFLETGMILSEMP